MASVDTAAPTDGAPRVAFHTLVKHLRATHALKVVIGKRLNHGAKRTLFDKPTVGSGVAKAETDRLLPSLAKGASVIVISSYLPEVYELADTLRVLRAGRISRHGQKDASLETITRGERRLASRARGVERK